MVCGCRGLRTVAHVAIDATVSEPWVRLWESRRKARRRRRLLAQLIELVVMIRCRQVSDGNRLGPLTRFLA